MMMMSAEVVAAAAATTMCFQCTDAVDWATGKASIP